MMVKSTIDYGEKTIEFDIEFKDRKAIKISVLPEMKVLVSAPSSLSIEQINSKVKRKSSWILKNLDYFNSFLPKEAPREYVSGETHCYLGRQYRLKIIDSNQNDVKLKGKFIFISTKNKDSFETKKKLLNEWYKQHAQKRFLLLIDKSYEKLRKYNILKPNFKLRFMKSRWGSCSPKKNSILLNTYLIKAPSHCIEYVIMHELCHLKYPHHNNQFYNFLSLLMPDWKLRKKQLEKTFI